MLIREIVESLVSAKISSREIKLPRPLQHFSSYYSNCLSLL